MKSDTISLLRNQKINWEKFSFLINIYIRNLVYHKKYMVDNWQLVSNLCNSLNRKITHQETKFIKLPYITINQNKIPS